MATAIEQSTATQGARHESDANRSHCGVRSIRMGHGADCQRGRREQEHEEIQVSHDQELIREIERILLKWADGDDNDGYNEEPALEIAKKIFNAVSRLKAHAQA